MQPQTEAVGNREGNNFELYDGKYLPSTTVCPSAS
jgi:hypothetical protein